MGRPGTKRPLWRTVRQSISGDQVRTRGERPSSRGDRRAFARDRARHGLPCVFRPPAHRMSDLLDIMISLTRAGPLHRLIIAGSDSMDSYLTLRRRGFIRVTTTDICRTARAQHHVGLVAGQYSSRGFEAVLDQMSPFLAANAGLALLVGSRDDGLRIRLKLEGLGFRIEAGVRCTAGLVLSAHRQDYA